MKAEKIVGFIFIVSGLFFTIAGIISGLTSFAQKDDRIYTIAHIVRIEEKETNDPDSPIDHTVYVELYVNEKKAIAQLNTYKENFYVGKEIDVYYMKNDLQMVYEKGSELYIIPYILFSLVFVITGIILVIKNNMKNKTFTSYVNDMQDKTLIY